jgi:hypothetical protein
MAKLTSVHPRTVGCALSKAGGARNIIGFTFNHVEFSIVKN